MSNPEHTAARSWSTGLGRHAEVGIALVVLVCAVYAFGGRALVDFLHPSRRPWVLVLHIGLALGWAALFCAQAALIHAGRRSWHRALGRLGIALGVLVPIAGIATAITMTRLHLSEGQPDGSAGLVVPLYEMLAFATAFGFALLWRKRPDRHRRLMLVASCVLGTAAFAHLPFWRIAAHPSFVVDALILAAAASDWGATRRVHPVYACALPLLILGQFAAQWIAENPPAPWLAFAHALVR